MSEQIPESHRDLLAGPVNVVLTTVMPDGQPQTTPIWCNLEGDMVLISTMKQFRKAKNMRGNPMVTLLAYRLKEPLRNIEVRGRVVEMSEEGAEDHLNELNMLYGAGPNFFGDSVDAELRHKFTPVKVKIQPVRVRVEG
ncbi:MAG: PPOX class F420-dependent oxidoreductase [Chloroflexi bacterium]|jgi:PPOX class probable F420-dependent enzyme|nr:PPOX class F420-dependent oxidoreductase [Chloroflexota bacterium]